MLDALLPAVAALEGGGELADALKRSAEAAAEGMRQTIPLEARKGRASYLGPRSVGHQDPGATSSHLLIESAASALTGDTTGRWVRPAQVGTKEEAQLSIFGAEVIGTALLILLGDGVVAAVLLSQSKAQNSGWIVITFGWAMAVMVGVFAVAQFSGAHLNPAVTVGFAVAGTIEWDKVPEYFAGEFVGAFIGATLVWIAYINHWRPTEDPGLKLAVFCTGPAIRNTAANIGHRGHRDVHARLRRAGVLRQQGDGGRPARRAARRPARARHRPVARRADGVRDQPGARPRPAHHARDPPDPRQGVDPTGATRGFPSWRRSSAASSPALAYKLFYPG